MKKVTYSFHKSRENFFYHKGSLYINEADVIILCTSDATDVLIGITLNNIYLSAVGDSCRVERNYDNGLSLYKEFHGTVTLEN
jgi:hypothetical protein